MTTVKVKYQFDTDSPVMETSVNYKVISETETEITFPNETLTFPNWDVKGVRETFFMRELEESKQDIIDDEGRFHTTIDISVKDADVVRFVSLLAQKPKYGHLFPINADEGSPKRKNRKFPYTEVARLWNEGKTVLEIATAIGYLDPQKDCTHTVRTFLTRMYSGYKEADGSIAYIAYRKSKERTVTA